MKFVLDKELESKGKLETRFTVSPEGATVFLLSLCCVTAGKSCPWLGTPSGQYPAALCGHPGPPSSEAGLRTPMLITSDAHLPISKMSTAQPALGSEESPSRTFCKAQCRPCSCAGPALLSPSSVWSLLACGGAGGQTSTCTLGTYFCRFLISRLGDR